MEKGRKSGGGFFEDDAYWQVPSIDYVPPVRREGEPGLTGPVFRDRAHLDKVWERTIERFGCPEAQPDVEVPSQDA